MPLSVKRRSISNYNPLEQSQDVSEMQREDSKPISAYLNSSRRQIEEKSTRIGKGVRVKVQRHSLFHMIPHDKKKR